MVSARKLEYRFPQFDATNSPGDQKRTTHYHARMSSMTVTFDFSLIYGATNQRGALARPY